MVVNLLQDSFGKAAPGEPHALTNAYTHRLREAINNDLATATILRVCYWELNGTSSRKRIQKFTSVANVVRGDLLF
jgi:hypothetical protein